MRSEKVIKLDMATAKANYEVSRSDEDAKIIKELQAELVSAITEGALNCACGNPPLGIIQQGAINDMVFFYYEIGCSVCKDKKVKKQSRIEAVQEWNSTYGK